MKNIQYVFVLVVASVVSTVVNAGHEARFYPIDQLVSTYIEKATDPKVVARGIKPYFFYDTFLKELNRLEVFKEFKQALASKDAAGHDEAKLLFVSVQQKLSMHMSELKNKEKQSYPFDTLGRFLLYEGFA